MNKIIGAWIREPEKKNEVAVLRSYSCSLDGNCPLLAKNKCIHYTILGLGCVYGNLFIEKTPTKRSKSYYNELAKLKNKIVPMPEMVHNDGIHLIGDYYYLPYSHITMCETVPFLAHSSLLSLGKPFIKKEDFTPEVIIKLCKFHPHAFLGGEITDYQKKEVPKFLLHLKQRFHALFNVIANLYPEYISTIIKQNSVDISKINKLKTTLNKIPIGKCDGYKIIYLNRTANVTYWDGKILKISADFDLILYFRAVKNSFYELTFEPDTSKTEVVVSDKSLIEIIASNYPETIYLD